MDTVTLILISTIALVVCVGIIIALTVAWLKAEAKIYRLGGETKWIKAKKKGGRK